VSSSVKDLVSVIQERQWWSARLTGNGLVEGGLGHLAGLVGGVQDLVVEDREVQGETETDRVGRGELSGGDLGGGLVSLEGLVGRGLALVAHGELGEVTVVVTLPVGGKTTVSFVRDTRTGHCRHNSHLVVEDLGFAALGRGDEVLLEDLKDVLADLAELGLDLLTVLLDQADLGLVALALLLLLDGGDDAPGGTTSTDDVLVGDGKQVPLLDGQLLVGGGNSLHVLDHLCGGCQRLRAV
jgi:hypothetical protein